MYGVLAKRDALFLVTRTEVPLDEALIHDHEEARSPSGQPTILPKQGGTISGLLATSVPPEYIKRLDGYFGPNYRRKTLEVTTRCGSVEAQVYVLGAKPTISEGAIL